MKIFITGIAGFLGSHLADQFIAEGHDVSGCDDFSGGIRTNVPRDIPVWRRDLTSSKVLGDIMWNVDVVYHAAAAPYEGVSVFSPAYICNNIYSGSVNVFTSAIKAGVKRIVFCSSMARYGTNFAPFHEYYQPTPQDPYGIAKVAAEQTLRILCEVHDVEYVIAVPHNIYGPKQYYFDPFRNVASIFVNAMLQDIQPIIYGDGEQLRSFSYVSDCVEPLMNMALDTRLNGEIINIGPDDNEISINGLYNKIAGIIGFDKPPIYMPDRPKEVKIAHCCSDKARLALNYQTKVQLDEGLNNLVEWIKDAGPKPFNYDKVPIEIVNDKTPKNWTDRMLKCRI